MFWRCSFWSSVQIVVFSILVVVLLDLSQTVGPHTVSADATFFTPPSTPGTSQDHSPSPVFCMLKVDAKTHPSPLCPLCNIHKHDTHQLFNCTHIRTTLSPLDLWTDPAGVTALLARWTEKLVGGPQAGTSPPPPTSKGHGSE